MQEYQNSKIEEETFDKKRVLALVNKILETEIVSEVTTQEIKECEKNTRVNKTRECMVDKINSISMSTQVILSKMIHFIPTSLLKEIEEAAFNLGEEAKNFRCNEDICCIEDMMAAVFVKVRRLKNAIRKLKKEVG